MSSKLFTFHHILAACEDDSHEGWQAFLGNYAPICFRLIDVCLPCSAEQREDFWRDTLGALTADNHKLLRKFEHQAEREFLVDLRAFLFDRGAERLNLSLDPSDVPKPTPESVGALLEGLPLIQQEVLFLKLCGYSDATIERMLVITPAVAQKGLERLRAQHSTLLHRDEDKCLWPAAWSQVMRVARAAKTETCPPLRLFIRIHDGSFGWSDKDSAEQHVSGCLYCLERWMALREIKHWRREARPRSAAEIDRWLSFLPVRDPSKSRRSFLARIFGFGRGAAGQSVNL